jgi:hypothetical protein
VGSDELIERIASLTREEAMEAALALDDALRQDTSEPGSPYVAEVNDKPYEHLAEIEDLSRLVLVAAASQPESRADLEEALDAVGQRAFIFGGAEIVALAGLGVFVFSIIKSRGIASEEEEVEIHEDKVVVRRKTVYVAGSGVMGKLLGRGGG